MASSLIDNNGGITTGLRADLMRKSMENKNLLSHKGSLYVGTGDNNSVIVNGSEILIPVTEELIPGDQYTVLTVVDSEGTLGYRKVSPDMMIENGRYDIQCRSAVSVDHANEASQIYYASADTSKGAIADRLNWLDTMDSSSCTVSYNMAASTRYSKRGTITSNLIRKQADTVSMELVITDCYLDVSYGAYDTITISIPSSCRPRGVIPISLCILGTLQDSTTDSEGGTRTYEVTQWWYLSQNIDSNGQINIDRRTISSSNNRGDVYKVQTPSSGFNCQGVRIYAGWNITQPTVDWTYETVRSGYTTTGIYITGRSCSVPRSKIQKMECYYKTNLGSSSWFYSILSIESGPGVYEYKGTMFFNFSSAKPKIVKIRVTYTDGTYLESNVGLLPW